LPPGAAGVAMPAARRLGACLVCLLGLLDRSSAEPGGHSAFLARAGKDGASAPSDGERHVMTLYHQTSKEAGLNILKEGFWMSKPWAICGAAIYMCPTIAETDVKAIGGRGYIIEMQVDVGRVKTMSPVCNMAMNEKRLEKQGYGSITLDRAGLFECVGVKPCREYVIYSNDRILSMKGYEHHGPVPRWWKALHPGARPEASLANATNSSAQPVFLP